MHHRGSRGVHGRPWSIAGANTAPPYTLHAAATLHTPTTSQRVIRASSCNHLEGALLRFSPCAARMLSRLASRLRTAAIGSALGLTAGLGAYAYIKVRAAQPHSRARYPILIKSLPSPGCSCCAHQWTICGKFTRAAIVLLQSYRVAPGLVWFRFRHAGCGSPGQGEGSSASNECLCGARVCARSEKCGCPPQTS